MNNDARQFRVRLRQEYPIPLNTDIACAPGELLALVGPSGAGKSTILRCIAGLHRPQYGVVTCNGTIWLDTDRGVNLPPQQRSVGLMFQQYALFPHLTAEANVVAALGHLPRAERADRARELLALVHLPGLETRRPPALSGGQQQRVALARALARDPAVLLLDEPFSAVDQVTRRKLQRELATLRRQLNIPIILVTHDLDEACALSDSMCILHHGNTLQTGKPFDVMAHPRDAEVAQLVDLRNLFVGEIVEHRPETGVTLLRWAGYVLEARHSPAFALKTRVSWLVAPSSVVLHRRDRPSRGEHENPVRGTITEFIVLGDTAEVTMLVDDREDCRLFFSVPTHVASRNRVKTGESVGVSLLTQGIHLMPSQTTDTSKPSINGTTFKSA